MPDVEECAEGELYAVSVRIRIHGAIRIGGGVRGSGSGGGGRKSGGLGRDRRRVILLIPPLAPLAFPLSPTTPRLPSRSRRRRRRQDRNMPVVVARHARAPRRSPSPRSRGVLILVLVVVVVREVLRDLRAARLLLLRFGKGRFGGVAVGVGQRLLVFDARSARRCARTTRDLRAGHTSLRVNSRLTLDSRTRRICRLLLLGKCRRRAFPAYSSMERVGGARERVHRRSHLRDSGLLDLRGGRRRSDRGGIANIVVACRSARKHGFAVLSGVSGGVAALPDVIR